ncbi:unnamed protein product [Rhizoctonia solani]|uniref:Uncharacterized protein n=1 Tax=Rhizoctonia solani TaxID=456999 RepID=A0A8H3HCM3_9AGAM|nr:unnamed protein product [Rhizoctonia solani]
MPRPKPSIMAALDLWVQSDAYHNKHLLGNDIILEQVSSSSEASGLMPIAVSAAQGKFLNLQVARKNIELAGLSNRIEVKVGPAAETLPTLGPDHSFDFAFIDADKESNPIYFKEAQRLVKPGGVVIVDNVVRKGRVGDENIKEEKDSSVKGVRELLRYVQSQHTVEATTIATVGDKGHDGFMYAIVGLGGSTRL